MDIDVSGWILEFLLRQNSVDSRMLNDLIGVLPIPNNNPRLAKSLILRKIESDIEQRTISDRTFKFLEQIEEFDLREGVVEVSEAMKTAYCTVAMYCTAKSIEAGAGDMKEKHSSAVSRIWSGRIRKFDISDVANIVGLVEDDLLRWMNDVEAGVLDADACENVLAKFKGLNVLDVLRRYVKEAKEKMGPSFLELAFETILSNEELSKTMGLNEDSELNVQIPDSTPSVDAAVSQDADAIPNTKSNARVRARYKPVGPRCFRKPEHGPHRGAKIVDPMETQAYDDIPTPEVNKRLEDLQTSSFELHAVVKDPLVEALRFAESIKANTSAENRANNHVVGNDKQADVIVISPSPSRNGKNPEANGNDGMNRNQRDRIKPNLMERNATAHTVEWSDSIDSPSEELPTRPHLPSPQKRPVSPLNVYKMAKLVKTRKKKRWTTIEEDTLRTGVQKYGKGNWKLILGMYRDIFEDRTEVDLKDKWRNLTRYY